MDKKQLSERDICTRFVTPALRQAGWDELTQLREEVTFTNVSDLVRRVTETYCATTVGNWGISASNLKEVTYPVSPLPEQQRIVAKVNELMALCDRLEAAQKEREAARDYLTAATLFHVASVSDAPPNRQMSPQNASAAIALLTVRSRQLTAWRQTILDLAVRGASLPKSSPKPRRP